MTKKLLGGLFLGVLFLLLSLSFWKRGIYSKNLGINLIVVGDLKVSILLIRPNEGLVSWMNLPVDLSVKVFKTGVMYPAVSLWKLGLQEKDPYNYVTKSLSASMGVVLPRVVVLGKDNSPESVLRALTGLVTHTNLSIRDRVSIRKLLSETLASKQILEIDLPETVLDRHLDPDGREVVTFNSVLGMWNKNKFLIESILGESVNAKVINKSDVSGLGLGLSKQLESAGLRVIEVQSGDKSQTANSSGRKGCYFVFGDESKHKLTKEFLENHVGCRSEKEVQNDKLDGGEVLVSVY